MFVLQKSDTGQAYHVVGVVAHSQPSLGVAARTLDHQDAEDIHGTYPAEVGMESADHTEEGRLGC